MVTLHLKVNHALRLAAGPSICPARSWAWAQPAWVNLAPAKNLLLPGKPCESARIQGTDLGHGNSQSITLASRPL